MQTVIGVFDDQRAAAHALDILKTSGFDNEDVQLQGRPFASEPAGQPPEDTRDDDSFFGSVSTFFSTIFGSDESEHSDVYSEAVRRGGYVVTVNASDEDEAEEVESVLDESGAIDIEERVNTWRAEGWHGSTGTLSSDWHGSRSPKGGL